MTNQFDYSNDKPDIRENIPAGIPLYLELTYTPGGYGDEAKCGPGGKGALTKSKEGDTAYLKAELTVLRGPYKGRKFWSNLTVEGGQVDENGRSKAGQITRKNIRAILDSSQGLASKDESPEAAAKRVIRGYADLQHKRFVALSKIGKAQNGYPAKNELGTILTVDMKDYPKTEAELDNPTVTGTAQTAAPATPAPAWTNAGATAAPAETQNAAAAPASNVTQFVASAAAPVQQPAQQVGNGLPAWAAPAA